MALLNRLSRPSFGENTEVPPRADTDGIEAFASEEGLASDPAVFDADSQAAGDSDPQVPEASGSFGIRRLPLWIGIGAVVLAAWPAAASGRTSAQRLCRSPGR